MNDTPANPRKEKKKRQAAPPPAPSPVAKTKKEKRKKASAEAAREDDPPIPRNWRIAALAAILLLTAVIYSNSLSNDFIYFDDPELVTDNYSIRQITADNLARYFTTPVQFTYLPVALISYAIDYQIGQLDPFIYHFNSLLLHLVTVLVVYWTVQLLTRKFYISIFATLLFAIHPVNVDGVAWVATRNNILATLFFLAALALYSLYIERDFKIRYLVLSVVAFILSALSKSSSVVLPLILVLWDYYYDRKWDNRLLLEKIPYVLVALSLGILTLNVRKDVVPPVEYNLVDRFIVFSSSLTDYFLRLVFPVQLSMSYAYPEKDGAFLPWSLYLSPLVLGLIVWGLYKLKVSRKVLVVGLLFFLFNIYLSQSVMLIDNFKANRYLYLSFIGLFLILGDFNHRILTAPDGPRSPPIKTIWIAAATVLVVGFSILTYSRNFVWKDTITLFDDVVSKQPNIPWVYSNRGIAKYRNNDFEGARQDFNRALALDPNFALSLYYRGVLSALDNDYQSAMIDLDQTVALVPDFSHAYNERGKVKLALQDYAGAIDDFSAALSLDSYFVEAYVNRGIARNDLGDYQGALADLDTAISFTADYPAAFYGRGYARSALGDYQGALADLDMAITLDPSYAEAYYIRSLARLNLNDVTGSCSDASYALSLGYQPAAQQLEQNCSG